MENQNLRRRGRPKIFTPEQLREHRTRYMLNKDWFCDVCSRRYVLAYKTTHLHTLKHVNNYINALHKM